ncbi:ABC transporter permease [Methanohalophilus mahii]
MSGQLIAGASPILAIKYQIAVMISVYVFAVNLFETYNFPHITYIF